MLSPQKFAKNGDPVADTGFEPDTDPAAVEKEDLGAEQCSEIATLARVDGGEEEENTKASVPHAFTEIGRAHV